MPGGCFFVQAAAELDDRPGPARDLLVRQQRDWLELIANVARSAVAEDQLDRQLDVEQFAFELWGIMLAWHHASRLLGDRRAHRRARAAFEALLYRSRS